MIIVGVRFGHNHKWPIVMDWREVEVTGMNALACKYLVSSFLVCAIRIILLAC